MPCNSDYMEADERECELTKVVQLLDELDGKGPPDPETYGNGYDKRVYNDWQDGGVKFVVELCNRLQKLETCISDYSLEMQMWWRDHQRADRERIEFELRRKKTKRSRDAALAKLTPYERSLLGL